MERMDDLADSVLTNHNMPFISLTLGPQPMIAQRKGLVTEGQGCGRDQETREMGHGAFEARPSREESIGCVLKAAGMGSCGDFLFLNLFVLEATKVQEYNDISSNYLALAHFAFPRLSSSQVLLQHQHMMRRTPPKHHVARSERPRMPFRDPL